MPPPLLVLFMDTLERKKPRYRIGYYPEDDNIFVLITKPS